MSKIEIEYDGAYPCTCMGTLKIFQSAIEIYSNQYACHSTGGVWFDDNGNEHVECGELIWNEEEANKFSLEIQEAVKCKLSEFDVCCGGCI